MPPGTEVGIGPGDIVLAGAPAPPTERGTATAPPHFLAHIYCEQTVAHLSNCRALVMWTWGRHELYKVPSTSIRLLTSVERRPGWYSEK